MDNAKAISEVKNRAEPSAAGLSDAARLEAIEHSGLLSLRDSSKLDTLTDLICTALDVPTALVSIVTDTHQIFPSAKGLPAPWDTEGQTPLSHSFCQHVVTSGLPLQVDDAPRHAVVCDNLAIRDLGVKAYLGTPIRDPDGVVLGSLCAIDGKPRKWQARDLSVLEGFSLVITEQIAARRAIANLRESNARLFQHENTLRRITETAPIMIAELSADLKYSFANAAYADMFKKRPEDIIGQHPRDVLSKAAYERAKPHLIKALVGEQNEFDLELPRPDGTSKVMRVHYAPERDARDAVIGIVVAVTDVTEQRLLSTLAEQLDDRLKAAHEMSPDGFMVFTAVRDDDDAIIDFEWEYVNAAGAEIAAVPVSDLIGKRLLTVLPGNKEEGLFDAYVNVVNTGQPYRKTSFYEQDGLSLWIDISAIKLGDGFAVSFSDVSERKKNERALADSAGRLQRILDNVVAFVGIMTPDGILNEVNQPALDVAGLSREDVIGKPFWEAYWWSFSSKTQARLKEAIADAQAGKSSRYDALIRISESQHIWIDFQLSPQFDNEGNIVEIIPSGTNINERKLAETHRQLLVNELNHRVKNTLATIQAMARQTIRNSDDMKSFEATFVARLSAISAAHEILVGSDNAMANLRTMIERQVGPYVEEGRQLNVAQSDIMLAGECAHSVGLVLHELATNAAKYGALSVIDGCVDITAEDLGDGSVKIIWTERGGPAVSAPSRTGFGSRLISQSIEFTLGGEVDIDYAKTGVIATLRVPKEFDHG